MADSDPMDGNERKELKTIDESRSDLGMTDERTETLNLSDESLEIVSTVENLSTLLDVCEVENVEISVTVDSEELSAVRELIGTVDSQSETQISSKTETQTESSRNSEYAVPNVKTPNIGSVQIPPNEGQTLRMNTHQYRALCILCSLTNEGNDNWMSCTEVADVDWVPYTSRQISSYMSKLFSKKGLVKRKGARRDGRGTHFVKYLPLTKARKLVAERGRFRWPQNYEMPEEHPPDSERPYEL